MDGATPSWLEEGSGSAPAAEATTTDLPPPVAAPAVETPAPSAAAPARAPAVQTDNVAATILGAAGTRANASAEAEAAAQAAADEKDLPRVILFMRVLNMAAAILLVTTSILMLVQIPHISVWVSAIYASFGGILVCCLETQLKFVRTIIAMNFGFLFNSVYRFLFYCLMASVTWSYKNLLGYITAITLACVAVFNTFVLCRYPAYRKMREKVAAEEDQRIQAKINQQVRKQAIGQMGWGKS
ncbi:hypothetical protein ACHAWF_003529 [Thalassiosira exigua]